MGSIKWEYTVAFIFAICSVVLILMIVVQTHYSENTHAELLSEIESVDSAGFTLQDIPSSAINDDTLDEYSELVERPLFFNGRRPIIVSEDEATGEQGKEEEALEDISLKLIGIIKIPDSVYALFRDPKAKPDESKFKRFKQGDDISGRRLNEIKADRVIISSATGTEEILLIKPRVHKAVRTKRKPKTPKRKNPFNQKKKK